MAPEPATAWGCVSGARSAAPARDRSYQQILAAYYPGTRLERRY